MEENILQKNIESGILMNAEEKLKIAIEALKNLSRSYDPDNSYNYTDYMGNESDAYELGVDAGWHEAGKIAQKALDKINE